MKTKKELIDGMHFGQAMFLTNLKAIPADKHHWCPMGKAKTPVQIASHCASLPQWVIASIEAGKMAEGAPGPEYATVDEAVAALEAATKHLAAYVEQVPDERLTDAVTFPWETTTVAGTLEYHEWNLTYHWGQISYIQMLLGDEEMHTPMG